MPDAYDRADTISLAYSVDADDAFMFHALRTGAIDTGALQFIHRRDHTAALNRLAIDAGADVVAVSVGVYPAIAAHYQMLPHGASVGRGFGPVVVAPKPLAPGIPISPFGAIFDALARGEVDAALLIHEGRLLYRERGLHLVVDLGDWWSAKEALPLPLGVNVIRRELGAARVAAVSARLRESIAWALVNRTEIIGAIAAEDRGDKALSNKSLIDHYLNLYANDDTAAMADDAKHAIDVLFTRARAAGLLSSDVAVDWAP